MEESMVKKLTRKRWLILIVSCLINLCIGSLYAWSVFAAPLAEHLTALNGTTVTTSDLSIVFTMASSIGVVTIISGGFVNDKLGPKWVVFSGGVLFGVAMIVSGFVTSIGYLTFSYGVCCGLAMGLAYGCTVSNSVKFFPDRRGLIGGIATASYGGSSIIIPPIANYFIQRIGVLDTFKLLGVVFLIIICVGAFFMEVCPPNFMPYGYEPKTNETAKNNIVDVDWKTMLKQPIFYVMILMLMCGSVFGLMTISQTSPIAQNLIGMSVSSATMVVSMLALFNGLGRIIAGFFSDIIGRANMLLIMLILAIGGLFLLYTSQSGDVVKFCIGISIIGLCFGSFLGVFPGFTTDQFGAKNNSVNYGIMFIGFSVAGYTGPMIMSSIYGSTGSYKPAFLVNMGLATLGIGLNILYRVITKRQKARA